MSVHHASPAAIEALVERAAVSPRSRQLVCVSLMLAVAVAIVAGALEILPSLPAERADDATLVTLIRGMAIIKALLAVIAGSALAWRLGRPAGTALVATYLAGIWLMVLGSVVVWQCLHVGWAALLFHTGELTVLLTAWRDGRSSLRWTVRT